MGNWFKELWSWETLMGILISLLAAALIAIFKGIIYAIKSKSKTSGFDLSGYWGWIVNEKDSTGKIFQAYELLKISLRGEKVFASIYQLPITYNGDLRTYKGCGKYRSNKISFSYANESVESGCIGSFNLVVDESSKTSVSLNGYYIEWDGEAKTWESCECTLKRLKLTRAQKLKFAFSTSTGKKNLMRGEIKDAIDKT